MLALDATGRLLGAARLLVLARFLTPHDFGMVAAGLALISCLESFSATGTHLALIQRGGRARELFDTAWTLGVIRGGILTGAIAFSAPAIGSFFAAPEAVGVLRAMALLPLLGGLTNIALVEFRQELTLAPYYVLHTSGALAEVCVALPLALWLGNAWALVGGAVALTVARVVVSYALHPYRPTVRLVPEQMRELFGYGRWIFVSTAIWWLLSDGVQVVVGKLVGLQPLGLYQMAWRVASVPATTVHIMSGVTVAAYAKLQDTRERASRAYLRVVALVALAAIPVGVGIAVYADDLVRLLLGDRWLGIVPSLRVLTVFGVASSLSEPATPLFRGVGQPRLQTLTAIVQVGILAALLVPLTVWQGPLGTAVAVSVASVGGAAATAWAVRGFAGVASRELALVVGGPLVACLPFVALRLWGMGTRATAGELAASLLASGVLYLSGLLLLDRLKLYSLREVAAPVLPPWLARLV